MLAISNWTKNGLQTENQNRQQKQTTTTTAKTRDWRTETAVNWATTMGTVDWYSPPPYHHSTLSVWSLSWISCCCCLCIFILNYYTYKHTYYVCRCVLTICIRHYIMAISFEKMTEGQPNWAYNQLFNISLYICLLLFFYLLAAVVVAPNENALCIHTYITNEFTKLRV